MVSAQAGDASLEVRSAELFVARRELSRPHRWGAEQIATRTHLWLRLRDADGREGLSELAPLPGLGEAPAEAERALQARASGLSGSRWPTAVEPLLAAVEACVPDAAAPACDAAWPLALLDLASQRAGMPLADWLAGSPTSEVRRNAMAGAVDAGLAARLEGLPAAGCVKLKLTADVPWPEQLAALRQLVDPPPLRLDVNGGWTRPQLAERRPQLAELPIEYLEQPLAPEDVAGLIEHAPGAPPLAADELLLDPERRAALLAADPPLTYVIKPLRLGLPASWRLAEALRARGRALVVTHLLEGAIGRAAAAHVARAVEARGGRAVAHGVDGAPAWSGAAGLGVTLPEDARPL